ncbi:MAG TPA: DUF1345 domain-containing protein [Casimicrobiaceae bacterium]
MDRILTSWNKLRRPRLTFGVLLGIAVYALMFFATDADGRMRFIGAWDAGATFTLIAMFFGLRNTPSAAMKQLAERQDAGKWAVLTLGALAATASLIVIAAEMPLVKEAEGLEQAVRVVLMIYTIVLSWAFMQTIFAVHYAHDYYMEVELPLSPQAGPAQRLIFPGTDAPTYGDFLYLSFTIGMTFQVSDVQIADPELRRLVVVHGVLAFFYSTGILALAINLVAGLI